MSALAEKPEWDRTYPPISRTTLALFAGASGDHNPIHIDIDAARSAGLPDVISHGMLMMAYVANLVTDNVDQSKLRRLEVRFSAVTPVQATPTCSARVIGKEDDDKPADAVEFTISLADGTVPVTGSALLATEGNE